MVKVLSKPPVVKDLTVKTDKRLAAVTGAVTPSQVKADTADAAAAEPVPVSVRRAEPAVPDRPASDPVMRRTVTPMPAKARTETGVKTHRIPVLSRFMVT